MILLEMALLWKLSSILTTCFLLQPSTVVSQTTLSPTATTEANTPESSTISTTTFVPTLTPLLTTEGTTLATADSEMPTTSFPAEESTVEATTEGQESNEAGRASGPRRGYQFDTTGNNVNQEAEPEKEMVTTQKPEEKKIAWKFGRGGNNQETWSSRPSPNSGYPVWKKQTPATSSDQDGQSAEGVENKPNDQGYIVWNVGQGNQANGWTFDGNSNSWTPPGGISVDGGWVTADGSSETNPDSGSWNQGGWSDEQSSENGETQGEWTGDEGSSDEGGVAGGWDAQNQNEGGWVNVPAQGPPPNVQPQNTWQSQDNGAGGGGGTWVVDPEQQNNNGQGGWVIAQHGGAGWGPQPPQGGSNGGPNGGWNNNGGGWVAPQGSSQSGNDGWNNDQQNTAGWQDENLSWKIYNEDTQTMENLDDNSGWKVVGDGGPDGWKLVDENGNIEWKIENINGEWKVTSADEFSSSNGTAPSTADSVNATSETTNDTSTEAILTTTPAPPSGGWDDDKQGRYVIWKFSDDGKGEARVYNGPGSKPEVWTVGDNNQWWKDTMGVKEAGPVAQGGYNSGNGASWQGNGGWQNTAPQSGNSYQNGGVNTQPQNNGWKANGAPQNSGANWQPSRPAGNGGGAWRKSNPPTKTRGNGLQGSQTGNNRWRNGGAPAQQQKWNNGAPAQNSNGWQTQVNKPGGWIPGNAGPATNGGWQTQPQSQGGNRQPKQNPQAGWQNGGGRGNGGQTGGGKPKGRWRNNGNQSPGRWVPNNANGATRGGRARGKVWNSGNGWQTAPGIQQKNGAGWANNPPSSNEAPPATATTSGRSLQTDQNKVSQTVGWPGNGGTGQTLPYIIVIKSPEAGDNGVGPNQAPPSKKSQNGNAVNGKPQSNRRNGRWKMNRAGSSGWQWNPQGGKEGWQWRDGWMGSGGGFGGWSNDKKTVYSNWTPTNVNRVQARKSSIQRKDSDKATKKNGGKMVFVFGTKRSSRANTNQPTKKGKKGKQVIIIDYSTGGKTAPKGDEGMKKDIESVIQALKTARPTGARGQAVWRQQAQRRKPQQRSR